MSIFTFGKFSETASNGTLYCDASRLAPVFAQLLSGKTYRSVSAEIYDEPFAGLPPDPETGELPYGKMLRRVAALGGDVPEVKCLGDIPPVEGDGETVLGIPLFAVGDYRGKQYTAQDLIDIERNFRLYSSGDNPAFPVPFVVGHDEDQTWLADTGLPAAGWVTGCVVSAEPTMRFSEGARLTPSAYAVPTRMGWAVFSEVGNHTPHVRVTEALGRADGIGGSGAHSADDALSSAPVTDYERFAEPTPAQLGANRHFRRSAADNHAIGKRRLDGQNARGALPGEVALLAPVISIALNCSDTATALRKVLTRR